jgi:hypothetical protein
MGEVLKFDKNGQWSLDKAQIIDIKSRKTLANLPSKQTPKKSRVQDADTGEGVRPEGMKQITPGRSGTNWLHVAADTASREMPKKITKCENLLDEMIELLEKAIPGVKSNHIFSMDHIRSVATAPHHEAAKAIAHEAIKSSNAHEHNKGKASLMVDQSKNIKHLAQGMTNFHMARDAKVRHRLSGQRDDE